MHIAAFVICLVGLVILTLTGDRWALKQLIFFLACCVGAVILGGCVLALLVG